MGRKQKLSVGSALVLILLALILVSSSYAAGPVPDTADRLAPSQRADAPPLYAFTLEALRGRAYPGGIINRRELWLEESTFTRYYIDYPSDGLTITGVLQIPTGPGPFPVVILLHGYYNRDDYWSGMGTWDAANHFSSHGYLTISPDFRSWGESDTGVSFFHTGLVIDTLNLISAVASLPEADASRIGLWGHSMGGGVATKALTVDSRIKAAVLYAPNSADDADLVERFGPGCVPRHLRTTRGRCNPGEIIPSFWPEDNIKAYLDALADPAMIERVAPIYHLDWVSAPVQIHIGEDDGQVRGTTPPEWSQKLYDALVTANKDVTFYSYPEQTHFFTGEAWTTFLDRAVWFFDAQLQ